MAEKSSIAKKVKNLPKFWKDLLMGKKKKKSPVFPFVRSPLTMGKAGTYTTSTKELIKKMTPIKKKK